MNLLIKVAKNLDQKEYFSFRLWEFCLRNTARLFPWYFLFAVLIRHPMTAMHGFKHYRKLVRQSPGQALNGTMNLSTLFRNLRQNKNNRRFILALGFCMKPFDAEKCESVCPAGFFNHRCDIMDQPVLLQAPLNGSMSIPLFFIIIISLICFGDIQSCPNTLLLVISKQLFRS